MFQLKKLLLTVKFANFSCQRLAQFPARFGATLIIACWATIINAQKIEIYFSFLHDTAIGLTKKNYFKGETYYCKPQNTPPPPHRKLTSSQRQPPPPQCKSKHTPPPPPNREIMRGPYSLFPQSSNSTRKWTKNGYA